MASEKKTENLRLERPSLKHKEQYEAMMDEWETYGGRLNPGALRRYSRIEQKNVTYEKWLSWMEEDRKTTQDLFFLMKENSLLGAISIRYKGDPVDGHSGFGIRPSERNKGYATKMLSLALPIIKNYGIDPLVLSCAKDNIGSAKTIQNNGGKYMREVVDDGETVSIYHIDLR